MENIILIDTSGSMTEDGKKSVIMYILNTIKNTLNEEMRIYIWNEEIKQYSGKLEFGKTNSSMKLSAFLNENIDENILIISDGCFSSEIKSVLKKYSEKLICILVGIDSNLKTLQKTFGLYNVFEASDTVAGISRYLSLKGGI